MLVTAFLIAVMLFVAGFFIGTLFDSFRISDASNLIDVTKMDTDSFIIEKEFFQVFSTQDCSVLNNRMNYLGERVGEIGNWLSEYDAKRMGYGEEYDQLKKKYFLLELNIYTLRKQIFDSCPNDNSPTILFFYETEGDNQLSLNQGYVLDSVVKKNTNVSIFSIDLGFDDPAISSVAYYYNVTSAPIIIVNFKDKFERYVSEAEINNLISA